MSFSVRVRVRVTTECTIRLECEGVGQAHNLANCLGSVELNNGRARTRT